MPDLLTPSAMAVLAIGGVLYVACRDRRLHFLGAEELGLLRLRAAQLGAGSVMRADA